MPDDIDQLGAELRQVEAQERELASKAEGAINAIGQWRQDKDRSFIVRKVIYLYVASLFVAILYYVYRGYCCSEDASAGISEIIKTAVLPVVTLVIGYYFGTSKK
jgi:hypothetical protein